MGGVTLCAEGREQKLVKNRPALAVITSQGPAYKMLLEPYMAEQIYVFRKSRVVKYERSHSLNNTKMETDQK